MPNKETGGALNLPLGQQITDRSSVRMTMTDTSDNSFNDGYQLAEEPDFYAGALKKTEMIFDDQLGPSSRFIESMNAPDQQYNRNGKPIHGAARNLSRLDRDGYNHVSVTPRSQANM